MSQYTHVQDSKGRKMFQYNFMPEVSVYCMYRVDSETLTELQYYRAKCQYYSTQQITVLQYTTHYSDARYTQLCSHTWSESLPRGCG